MISKDNRLSKLNRFTNCRVPTVTKCVDQTDWLNSDQILIWDRIPCPDRIRTALSADVLWSLNRSNGVRITQTRPFFRTRGLCNDQIIRGLPGETFSEYSTSFCEQSLKLQSFFSKLLKYSFFCALIVSFLVMNKILFRLWGLPPSISVRVPNGRRLQEGLKVPFSADWIFRQRDFLFV